MEEDRVDKASLAANEGYASEEEKDWADNESVTTDEEHSDPPAKKNIHARRWKLIPKDDGSFTIEGGRKPKEIRIMPRAEIFENEKHLAEADFILPRLNLARFPGRNGHISPGIFHSGYISRTLETMGEEFQHYQTLWLASPACTSLRRTFDSLKREQDSRVGIDNIVCLALGSLQAMMEECRAASLTQLAVLLTVIGELDLDPKTTPGKFVAQDPIFTPLDAEFLSSLGFVVKSDPDGFLAITENTLVFSIAGYLEMEWVISRGPWPAAMVWGDTEAFMNRLLEEKVREGRRLVVPTRRERGEIMGMLGGCDVVELVGEGEDALEAWDGIGRQRVYWRRREGEGKGL
ncbi:hypothetical protein VE01_08419 [Pseudogymnoascus verrucosus]|uniref:SRR1-like domain-containing protein n=1 Tax=Pseudogymnoascus verrucosus TaxID=342668 RepID=A0A1B8GBX9_9PEZI|nr:uncharacterized protein VE01_08419 [Pseudogymnoascus verrucosus]OBT93320.1 hypothetical protein VE01_08419 [Pseudogymnoascus verrucosus]